MPDKPPARTPAGGPATGGGPGPDDPASRLIKDQFYQHLARRISDLDALEAARQAEAARRAELAERYGTPPDGAAAVEPAGAEQAEAGPPAPPPAAPPRRRVWTGPKQRRLTPEERRRRLVAGKHVTVRFDRMGPDGEAVATVEGRTLVVPYAAPGDEATIRLLEVTGESLRGQIVALRSISARVTRPPCPHFGRCGGCQWQHLDYPTQLEQKTLLVREALERAGLARVRVDPATGWEPPWEFRTRLEAAVSVRAGRPVVGFFAWGGERIVDVRTCPVKDPANAAVLAAVRAALDSLASVLTGGEAAEAAAREEAHRREVGRPLGQGILRGVLARTAAATGEVMLGLSVATRLGIPGRAMAVRALLDRIPGLVSIMEVRVQRRSHLLRGRRARLLWGRPYVRDEAAGVRYHVPLLAEYPSNARAFPGIVEALLGELDPRRADMILEPDAGIGAYTLQLALACGRVIGITDEEWMDAAWDNVRLNQMGNCVFYTRDPLKALEKAVGKWGPVRLAFLKGGGVSPDLLRGLRKGGVRRLVYLGRTLRQVEQDAAALAQARFRIARAQPLDVSPHTSRLAVLLTASAR